MRFIEFSGKLFFALCASFAFASMAHEPTGLPGFGCGVLGWIVVDVWWRGAMK